MANPITEITSMITRSSSSESSTHYRLERDTHDKNKSSRKESNSSYTGPLRGRRDND